MTGFGQETNVRLWREIAVPGHLISIRGGRARGIGRSAADSKENVPYSGKLPAPDVKQAILKCEVETALDVPLEYCLGFLRVPLQGAF